MAIKTHIQPIPVGSHIAEGVKVEWEGFSLLVITAPKGVLGCGIFDIAAFGRYGKAAALVQGGPDNPIGTIDRMVERTILSANEAAQQLGITPGMPVRDALTRLF